MSQGTARSAADSLPSPKERRRLREAKALTEDQVAEALGVTRATVRSWETGRSTPRGRKREAYVKLLGAEEPEPAPLKRAARKPPTRPASRPRTTPPPAPPEEHQERQEHQEHQERLKQPQLAVDRAPEPDPEPVRRPEPQPEAVRRPELRPKPVRPPEPEPEPVRPPEPTPEAVRPPRPKPEAVRPPEAADPAPAQEGVRVAERDPEPEPAVARARAELTPEGAFDALYAHAAPGLVHQTYLLTGRRRLSRESVERAFHHAWQHWPEVAVDRDPVGWVRAVAYEFALSPWHRLRRAHRHPDAPPTDAGRRAILQALLELPPPYRRTVLLYDGLGLDLPDTAAETEASTPAAANRLLYARACIGRAIPELADPDALHARLRALVAEAPTVSLAPAHAVRSGSERRTRLWTRSTYTLTAALIGATAFTLHTAPTQYVPEVAPGQVVEGVPVRGGPEKLGPEDEELRDALRSQPHHGPERLVPQAG
ncbi:sigma factor-like helix-turn-helix DNA-binding protein [Streptomyces tritici]|uniref:sigma factor-like helix-turn-helix DNA-binding protein n=1 Tax=Streptomyces tritici TaxID=2054410 RepID=UPI003AF0DDEE